MKKELHGFPSPTTPREKVYDRPDWAWPITSNISLNSFLPTDALMAGYELREIQFDQVDPWYLYDREGHIIHEWLHRPPSLGEVFDLCAKLLSEAQN